MVISCGSVGSLSVGWGRSGVHSTESGSHSVKAVVREELQLEEQEEAEEDSIRRDIGPVDEVKCLICNKHLGEFLLYRWLDGVFVIFHKHSFLDGELSFLAVGGEERGRGGVVGSGDVAS